MTTPPELLGPTWDPYFAGRLVRRQDVVRAVLRLDPGDPYEPVMLVGQLRDGRWLWLDDGGGHAIADHLHALWWQIPLEWRGRAPVEAALPIGCAACDHAAPHPCEECVHEERLFPCEVCVPIPGAIATVGWSCAFSPMEIAPVIALDHAPATPFGREDVVEVAYHDDGTERGLPWTGLFRLRDGRWAHVYHAVVRGEVTRLHAVAAELETLWWHALGDLDRERFAPRLVPEHRPLALVAFDRMLGSSDPAVVARAEAAIARLREAWRG